ncbi:TlpA disulfide reductase family protein [Hyphomonas sp.]|uniref:TlpA family protein disulfide reductase n=1 Tax=Hyphomonas sp. TaxID=87 RepID=UPI0032EE57D9
MIRTLTIAALALSLAACSGDRSTAPDAAPDNAARLITANPPPAAPADTGPDANSAHDGHVRPEEYALLGQKFPRFTATMADGQTFDSSVLNRWMVIQVWGTWCSDSLKDAPYAAALATAIEQDPDLYFLSIHVPQNADKTSDQDMYGAYGSVEAYFAEKGYSYPTVIDSDASVREALKITWTPSYILMSPDGVIRGFRTDLSVAGGEPVKDFLKEAARVKGEVRKAEFGGTPLPATIGPQGAMRLTGETPFTLDAMKAAFPGHEILSDRAMAGEQSYPVFLVQTIAADGMAGRLVYVVEPDWTLGMVGSVVTRNPAVTGPDGGTVGTMKLKDLTEEARARCTMEPGPIDSLFICPDNAGSRQFIRAFGAGSDFDGRLDDASPDYRQEAVLLEMKFIPPQAGKNP